MISVDVIYFVFLDLQVMPAIMEKIDGIYFVMITVDLIFFCFFPGLQVLSAVMQKIGGILMLMMSVDHGYF